MRLKILKRGSIYPERAYGPNGLVQFYFWKERNKEGLSPYVFDLRAALIAILIADGEVASNIAVENTQVTLTGVIFPEIALNVDFAGVSCVSVDFRKSNLNFRENAKQFGEGCQFPLTGQFVHESTRTGRKEDWASHFEGQAPALKRAKKFEGMAKGCLLLTTVWRSEPLQVDAENGLVAPRPFAASVSTAL